MPEFLRKPFTFDRVIRIALTVISVIGLWIFLREISGALIPFVVALLLAYLINPLVNFFQKKLMFENRLMAVIASFLILLIIATGSIQWIFPIVKAEIDKMAYLVGQYTSQIQSSGYIPEVIQTYVQKVIDPNDLKALLTPEQLGPLAEKILPRFWQFFSGSLSVLFGFLGVFIIVLYLFFILIDYDSIVSKWKGLIPPQIRPQVIQVVDDVNRGMEKYFRAQAVISLITGVLLAIGFSIIGLPLAILLGLFIGTLNMVPYLQAFGIIPAAFCALLMAMETQESLWSILLLVLIVFAIVQVIQDGILVPRIMGDVTGLNPAVILLSLSIWGSLLGLLGMLLALPMTSLLVSYYTRFIADLESTQIEENIN